MHNLQIALIVTWVTWVSSYYSRHYKRCKLFNDGRADMGSLKFERLAEYAADNNFLELTNSTLPLQYEPLEFIYDEYIDAGGSGEVYRIENLLTNKVKVLKRFFKENVVDFEQENYAMRQMNYEVEWHREDNDPNKSTLASYPSK
jgi:hypothetical protein